MAQPLKFEGARCFRQRLVLSVLSGKPVKISKIRHEDDNPGLRGVHMHPPALMFCPCFASGTC